MGYTYSQYLRDLQSNQEMYINKYNLFTWPEQWKKCNEFLADCAERGIDVRWNEVSAMGFWRMYKDGSNATTTFSNSGINVIDPNNSNQINLSLSGINVQNKVIKLRPVTNCDGLSALVLMSDWS